MQIILLEKVRNLGELGDQVNVRPGYARNFLIPAGKAVAANDRNRAYFESRRAELEKAQADAFARAQARAEAMRGATVQIARKASEEGKLFGSVATTDVAEAMTAAGFPLAKSEIQLSQGPLKALGDHAVQVSLHPEITFTITVSVVGEK